MGLGILWMLLPDEALVLVVLGAALAVLLGLVAARSLVRLLGLLLLLPFLGPLAEWLFSELPPWVGLAVLVVQLLPREALLPRRVTLD